MREATRQKEIRHDMAEYEAVNHGYNKFAARKKREMKNWIWSINKRGKERVTVIEFCDYYRVIMKKEAEKRIAYYSAKYPIEGETE
jgi:hypothetical protein